MLHLSWTDISPLFKRTNTKKNFAKDMHLNLAGILICLALSNLALMEDEQDQKSEQNGQRIKTIVSYFLQNFQF